jgi:hypothetical protein
MNFLIYLENKNQGLPRSSSNPKKNRIKIIIECQCSIASGLKEKMHIKSYKTH